MCRTCLSMTTARRCGPPPASATRSTKTSKKKTRQLLESNLQLRQERQMVRGHQRLSRARHFHACDVDVAFVINMVEVQERQNSRIGAFASQVHAEIDG